MDHTTNGGWWALVLISFFYSSYSPADTLHVCATCEHTTIQSAVAAAATGDTIDVAAGHYSEDQLVITKPLTLVGENRPTIDGRHHENVILIEADRVTVRGFAIRNSGESALSEYSGIRVQNSRDCTIADNVLEENTYSIYLARVDGCLVAGNTMTGNAKDEVSGGNGLHMWNSRHITAQNNTIQYHRDGIYLEFTDDSILSNNHSTKNIRYGLHFMYSHRDQYLRNLFDYNLTGVAVMYSHGITMDHNEFSHSWGRASYGLLLKEINDSNIVGNRFFGNTIGIYMDGVNRCSFLDNTFSNSGWGVRILGSAYDNRFVGNNFLHNYFDVATNSRESNNLFDGNYWSDYRGYDLNRDGVGDVPFRPMKVFSLWVSQYPDLVALLESPVIDFLEMAERIFPMLTPKLLQDNMPRMKGARL